MTGFRFAPRAEADLDAIVDYLLPRRRSAARKLLDRIEELGSLLASAPEAGEARPDLGPEVRFFSDGWYVIYYRPVPGGVEILRVLHGSRHVDRYTFED